MLIWRERMLLHSCGIIRLCLHYPGYLVFAVPFLVLLHGCIICTHLTEHFSESASLVLVLLSRLDSQQDT